MMNYNKCVQGHSITFTKRFWEYILHSEEESCKHSFNQKTTFFCGHYFIFQSFDLLLKINQSILLSSSYPSDPLKYIFGCKWPPWDDSYVWFLFIALTFFQFISIKARHWMNVFYKTVVAEFWGVCALHLGTKLCFSMEAWHSTFQSELYFMT